MCWQWSPPLFSAQQILDHYFPWPVNQIIICNFSFTNTVKLISGQVWYLSFSVKYLKLNSSLRVTLDTLVLLASVKMVSEFQYDHTILNFWPNI